MHIYHTCHFNLHLHQTRCWNTFFLYVYISLHCVCYVAYVLSYVRRFFAHSWRATVASHGIFFWSGGYTMHTTRYGNRKGIRGAGI